MVSCCGPLYEVFQKSKRAYGLHPNLPDAETSVLKTTQIVFQETTGGEFREYRASIRLL